MGLALPAAQRMHTLASDAPVLGLYVPEGHCSNAMLALVAPTLAQKPPVGHALQLGAPVDELKDPTGHASHSLAPLLDAN